MVPDWNTELPFLFCYRNELLDPYAFAHMGELEWNPALFGHRVESGDDLTFDERDSAPFMPKCTVVDQNFDWTGERGRKRLSNDHTIIYEVHVRGYTKQHPAVPEHLRGTYAGLAAKEVPDVSPGACARAKCEPDTPTG